MCGHQPFRNAKFNQRAHIIAHKLAYGNQVFMELSKMLWPWNIARGCSDGEPRFGLRREARRHAAVKRPRNFTSQNSLRPSKSGVAAAALPLPSKTQQNHPAAPQITATPLIAGRGGRRSCRWRNLRNLIRVMFCHVGLLAGGGVGLRTRARRSLRRSQSWWWAVPRSKICVRNRQKIGGFEHGNRLLRV